MTISGKDLKAFRNSLNLSQRAFSKLVKLQHSTISKLENDKLKIESHIEKYYAIGFGNNTTFTAGEWLELKGWQNAINKQVDNLVRNKADKSDFEFTKYYLDKLNSKVYFLQDTLRNDNDNESDDTPDIQELKSLIKPKLPTNPDFWWCMAMIFASLFVIIVGSYFWGQL